ncbi:MAG: DUF1002 domain-containing protein [Lachnospiraceae bacterium]|nr:DUF1002 domain-containing protein [Lachnospiraceae bacterium]
MKKHIKYSIILLTIIMISINTLLQHTIYTYADSSKIVTLGADLSQEQIDLMISYFGVNTNEVDIITVTNADEHRYLDGIATPGQIGSKTFSCTYIEPTNSGGIHVKTVNLTWVTCDMIKNALVTSGITDCNVIAAAPIQVSGTGSLTGIFMAYEQASGEVLNEEKVEIASEELITTMEIAEDIGQDNASTLLSDLKSLIITEGIENSEEILNKINKYIEDNKIELTEEQKWQLVELLLKISKQEYDIDKIKEIYNDAQETIQFIEDVGEEAKPWIDKFGDWLETSWQKITGTYEEIVTSEEYNKLKEDLGIIANTNDSLLSDSTVVTSTDSMLDTLKNDNNLALDNDMGLIDRLAQWFTEMLAGEKTEETIENKGIETQDDTVTFEDFSNIVEDSIDSGVLDKITYELQNGIDENSDTTVTQSGIASFDDLTK